MLGEEPPDEGVADYIGLSVEAYHELLRDAQRRFSLSLSRPIDDEQTMLDVLPNEDAEAGFERFEKASTQKHLQNLIETLPERQQTILGLYYTENLTLSEIGEVLDLSAARISQLLGKIQLTLESKFEEHARQRGRPPVCRLGCGSSGATGPYLSARRSTGGLPSAEGEWPRPGASGAPRCQNPGRIREECSRSGLPGGTPRPEPRQSYFLRLSAPLAGNSTHPAVI